MRLPNNVINRARSLLKGNARENIDGLKSEIVNNPRAMPFTEKWGSIVSYLTSSKVPLSKKVLALGGILWVVLPDPILGPVDDVLITMALVPWLDGELEKFASGQYDREISVIDSSVEPELEPDKVPLSSTGSAPEQNPFYLTLDEIERQY